MKRFLLVLVLVAIIGTGTVFADHPDGWGIGVVGGYSGAWRDGYGHKGTGWALSLKAPMLPIFWAINMEIDDWYFGIGVRGDYYFIDNPLVPEIGLHWYLGLGGYGNIWVYNSKYTNDSLGILLGARLPIGLSWQPIDILEIFVEIAPSLGVMVSPKFRFPAGGWGGGLGIRVWF